MYLWILDIIIFFFILKIWKESKYIEDKIFAFIILGVFLLFVYTKIETERVNYEFEKSIETGEMLDCSKYYLTDMCDRYNFLLKKYNK